MDVNTLNNVSSAVSATYSKTTSSKESEKVSYTNEEDNTAVVYERSSEKSEATSASVSYADKVNNNKGDRSAIIKQLQEESERLKNNLLDIVRKSLAGQTNSFLISLGDDKSEAALWKKIANGEFTATADEIAKAKEDISENGYWGVEQTSKRIVDFAITLSGGNTEKADMLFEAFKKGFSQAMGIWGKDLPEISQKTYDAVSDKFEQWKNGTYTSESNA